MASIRASGAPDPGSNPGRAIMKLILELKDEDIGMKYRKIKMEIRSAARAILIKGKLIALCHVTKDKYHKLPGGGREKGESLQEALKREILEETGCKIKVVKEVGKVIEFRTNEGILRKNSGVVQTSYCYIAEVVKVGKPKFDKGEKNAGYKLEWHDIDSAMNMMKKERPLNYEGKFIIKRDLALLKAAKEILGK